MGTLTGKPPQVAPMPTHPIDGVAQYPLKEIPTQGGPVLHFIRADHPAFSGFGEVYFSTVEPAAVKAWKKHTRQNQLFAVPHGRITLVVYDPRTGSPSFGQVAVYTLGRPDAYALLRVPCGVWYGFTAASPYPALLANCADIPHDPAESEKLPADSPLIPYSWGQ